MSMMNIEEIKQEAGRLEGYEAWSDALELYQTAISQLAETGDSDPSLFSRAGDLHLRLQRPEAAAECYETAIDLYVRGRSLDNAFAVCQKVLRHLPHREQVYLRVARIRAAQGLPEYARQHYLTYAKMRGDQGDREEAVRTLEELVGVVPGDLETRVFLADRLAAEGRRYDALAHLHEGYRRGVAARDRKGLDRLRERIMVLDPQGAAALFGSMPDEPQRDNDNDVGGERKSGPLSRFLAALRRRSTREEHEAVDAPPSGESTGVPSWAREADFADNHVESAANAVEPYEPQAQSDGSREHRPDPEPAPSSEPVLEPRASVETPAPIAHVPAPAQAARVEPPPPPADIKQPTPTPAPAPYGRQTPREPAPPPPDDEEAQVRALLAAEPWVVAHHERYVRWAAGQNNRELMIDALLRMAMALRAAGLEWRARSTLARVLSMDSTNARALEALGYGVGGAATSADPFLRPPLVVFEPAADEAATATPPAPPAAPAPEPAAPPPEAGEGARIPDEGYVDLAALIFDEPIEASTTRWHVAPGELTDDEDADFARVLTQFKDKVSDHLEHSDARAHYELGSAYRGMGLLGEAIGMFQEALRAEPDFLPATEMLGRTFLDNGEIDAAIKVLNRGVELDVAVEDDLIGIYYYLGNAHEMKGNASAAKDFYMRVFALDINFIDVTERLRALR
jgi:tetratricopeptide (TPR) repeat protein